MNEDTISHENEISLSRVSPVETAIVEYVNSFDVTDPCKTGFAEGSRTMTTATTGTTITNQAPCDSVRFTQGFSNEAVQDPICSAASLAYLDARMSGQSDEEAFAAATTAFIEALGDSDKEPSEACADMVDSFIDAL